MADGLYVTGNFFRALGLGAQAGRLLSGRRRSVRRTAGRRALVGLRHRAIRFPGGRSRTIDPHQRRRVHRRRHRTPVVSWSRPGTPTQFLLAAALGSAARGGEPASRATWRRRAGRGDAGRQYARDVREPEIPLGFSLGAVAAWDCPRAGRSEAASAVRSVLRGQCPRPSFAAKCAAAPSCDGDGGSRRHAQKLR